MKCNCYVPVTGIYFAVGAIGAAIGYVSGGQSLTLYVDFNRVDMSTSVHQKSSQLSIPVYMM